MQGLSVFVPKYTAVRLTRTLISEPSLHNVVRMLGDRLRLSRHSLSVCCQADSISNMAASDNAEQTQLHDMEEEDAGMEEREAESEEEEDGMGAENTDDEEDDSSEDEKETEAEIQRLEEQVIHPRSKRG